MALLAAAALALDEPTAADEYGAGDEDLPWLEDEEDGGTTAAGTATVSIDRILPEDVTKFEQLPTAELVFNAYTVLMPFIILCCCCCSNVIAASGADPLIHPSIHLFIS
jgi:hypothetical protein